MTSENGQRRKANSNLPAQKVKEAERNKAKVAKKAFEDKVAIAKGRNQASTSFNQQTQEVKKWTEWLTISKRSYERERSRPIGPR